MFALAFPRLKGVSDLFDTDVPLPMLRLKQTLRRPVLCARGVKTWHKDLEAPLKRVGARIDAALQVLHGWSGGRVVGRWHHPATLVLSLTRV